MGQCSASSLDTEIKQTEAIDQLLMDFKHQDDQVRKLLLLGVGSSGKSTTFKQFTTVYGNGFSDSERDEYRAVILRNTLQSMQTLLLISEEYEIPMDDFLVECGRTVLNADRVRTNDPMLSGDVVEGIEKLWNSKEIKSLYDRRNEFQLIDSCKYFFEKIRSLVKEDYVPNDQDIYYSRSQTTGIAERKLRIQNVDFLIVDVGGQRNERKKWIHCFDAVTALLYVWKRCFGSDVQVAAINEYDQVLYEDSSVNRMDETLRIFESTVNSEVFIDKPAILFLNKKDLFAEKIQRVPLTQYFRGYKGDVKSYDECVAYVKGEFEALCKHAKTRLYTHVTCATDTTSAKFTFSAMVSVVINANLTGQNLGMLR